MTSINSLTQNLIKYGLTDDSMQSSAQDNIIIALATSPKGLNVPLILQLNEGVLFLSSRDFITEYSLTKTAIFLGLAFPLVGYKFYTHPQQPKTASTTSIDICSEVVFFGELTQEVLFTYVDSFYQNIDQIYNDLTNLKLVNKIDLENGSTTLKGA